jgi:hypothetical protein
MLTWTPERKAAYRNNCWHSVEADNGAVYQIDLGLIQSVPGAGATAVVYSYEGDAFNPMNLKRWEFTCDGHIAVWADYGLGPWIYAPPRSVARHISDIVCAGAQVGNRK